jgi:hypothetical protein
MTTYDIVYSERNGPRSLVTSVDVDSLMKADFLAELMMSEIFKNPGEWRIELVEPEED